MERNEGVKRKQAEALIGWRLSKKRKKADCEMENKKLWWEEEQHLLHSDLMNDKHAAPIPKERIFRVWPDGEISSWKQDNSFLQRGVKNVSAFINSVTAALHFTST